MGVVHEFDTQKPWWSRWSRRNTRLALFLAPLALVGVPLIVYLVVQFLQVDSVLPAPRQARRANAASATVTGMQLAAPHPLQKLAYGNATHVSRLDRLYEDWAAVPFDADHELLIGNDGIHLWKPADGTVRDDSSLGRWRRPVALADDGTVLIAGWLTPVGEPQPPRDTYLPRPADLLLIGPNGVLQGKLAGLREDFALIAPRHGEALVIGGARRADGEGLREVESVSWKAGEPLRVRRVGDTRHAYYRPRAVALPNDRIMVVGSKSRDDHTTCAEIYDARTGEWSDTQPLSAAHGSPLVVATPAGDVVVISSSVEIFDHRTAAWKKAQAPRAPDRPGAVALMLDQRRLLLVGGGEFRQTEILDVESGEWRPGPKLALTHTNPATRLLPDGSVALIAGRDSTGSSSAGMLELLAGSTLTAAGSPDMLGWETTHAEFTPLADGRVLVSGGLLLETRATDNAEIIDPATHLSAPAAPMNRARGMHQALRLADGSVLVLGGTRDLRHSVADERIEAERFDPASGTWHIVPGLDLEAGPRDLPFVLRKDVPQVIGFDMNWGSPADSPRLASVQAWVWSMETGKRTALPVLTSGRERFSAVELDDGRLALVGGITPRDLVALEPRCAACPEEYVPFGAPASSASSDVFDFKTQRWRPGPVASVAGGNTLRLRDGRVLKIAVSATDGGLARLFSEVADREFTHWTAAGSARIDRQVQIEVRMFEMDTQVAVFTRDQDSQHHAFLWSIESGELMPWPRGEHWVEVAAIDDHRLIIAPGQQQYPARKNFEIVELP